MAKASASRDAPRANPINVLAKAGAILDALDEGGELTPSELAERVREPRSSVYRLLDSLESLGFIAPGVTRGHVQLGMRLYGLGMSAVRNRDVRGAAIQPMLELREHTGSTVFLAVRHDYEALCIERLEGRTTVNNALLPGTTGPLHIGAVGRVLLAAEPRSFWEAYAARGLIGFTPWSLTTADALFAELEKVQREDVSISDQDRLLGMAGVGAPVRDHTGRVCAALSFSAPRPLVLEDREQESRELIRDAAARISRGLGYDATQTPRVTEPG